MARLIEYKGMTELADGTGITGIDVFKNCLIYFHGDFCQPCKAVRSELDANEDDFNVIMVDVVRDITIANAFDIKSIPTLVRIVDGVKVKQTNNLKDIL